MFFLEKNFCHPHGAWNLQGLSFNRSLTYFLPWIDRTWTQKRSDFFKKKKKGAVAVQLEMERWTLGVMMLDGPPLGDGWRKFLARVFVQCWFSKSDAERAIYYKHISSCDFFFRRDLKGLTIYSDFMDQTSRTTVEKTEKPAPKFYIVSEDGQIPCSKRVEENHDMGVSKNRGTPKSSILIGFSITNHPFWGIPIFGNPYISWLVNLHRSRLLKSATLLAFFKSF